MAKLVAKAIPEFVIHLQSALEARVPGASTDAERVMGLDHYFWRVAVLSEQFRELDYDQRHDLVWGIARETLEPHRLRLISMILCLTPEELEGQD